MNFLFNKHVLFSAFFLMFSFINVAYGCSGLGVGHINLINNTGGLIHYQFTRDKGKGKTTQGDLESNAKIDVCWSTNIKEHGGLVYGENLSDFTISKPNDNYNQSIDSLTCKIKVVNAGVRYGRITKCEETAKDGASLRYFRISGCNNKTGLEICSVRIGLQQK